MCTRRNRVFGRFFRRLEKRPSHYIKAQIGKRCGNHFLAPIMPVLPHFGEIDGRRTAFALAEAVNHLAQLGDFRVIRTEVFFVNV